MMDGIPTTMALDIALPAPVAVDKLEEVVLTPMATDSNMIDPVESLMGEEDNKYIPDGVISPPEDEIMGLRALEEAELINGSRIDGNASVHNSQGKPVSSQETIQEDGKPPSSSILWQNLSQNKLQPSQLQAPSSEPQQLRGGQLGNEISFKTTSSLQTSTTAGQKRPANGSIGRSASSSSSRSSTPQNGTSTPINDGPDAKRQYKQGGHTRTISAISTASSAMSPRELTNELKTRLSYAMVKVQKGWESLPIYDLESMASQSGSPSSSSGLTLNGRQTSALGSTITSPRVALARDQSILAEPGKDAIMRDPLAENEGANDNGNGYSRTYESFWRSQAQRTLTSPSNAQHAHLAPPVDVGSQQRPNGYLRRSPSHGKRHQRSGLSQSTSDLSTSSRYSTSSVPALPYTPLQNEDMATRITSALINDRSAPILSSASLPNRNSPMLREMRGEQAQNKKTQSMQEQDAIETLLFMSSPGGHANPLNFPPPSQASSQTHSSQSQSQPQVPQDSPLKTTLSQKSKQQPYSPDPPSLIRSAPVQPSFYGPDGQLYSIVSHDKLYDTSLDRAARRKEADNVRRKNGGRLTGEEIERLIDSYKGESSDDEVEIPLPAKRPDRKGEGQGSGSREDQMVVVDMAPEADAGPPGGGMAEESQRQVSSGQAERQRVPLPSGAENG